MGELLNALTLFPSIYSFEYNYLSRCSALGFNLIKVLIHFLKHTTAHHTTTIYSIFKLKFISDSPEWFVFISLQNTKIR